MKVCRTYSSWSGRRFLFCSASVVAVAVTALLAESVVARPQQRQKDVRFPAASRSAARFFVSPIFDREGQSIGERTQEEPQKEEPARDPVPFRPSDPDPVFATRPPPQVPTTTSTTTTTTTTTTAPRGLRDRPDPVGFSDDSDEEKSLVLPFPVVPAGAFGDPDLILAATEQLRSLDPDHAQFISAAGDNAGLLPIRGEVTGTLNLFPPLRHAVRIPKK